jgi:hypothetical protein
MSLVRTAGRVLAIFTAVATAGCAGGRAAGPPLSSATAEQQLTQPVPVASVDSVTIFASELEAHQAATGLPRAEALEDLIDLLLLRAAARANGIALAPGRLEPDVRAAAEAELATRLALEIPTETKSLIVDHAWVKDAAAPRKQAAQRAAMERLRSLCAAGDAIPAAFAKLTELGPAAADWHIGDHEEYAYDVVPDEAHDLPAGTLSPIIPGNGGLHLFRIIERKGAPPPPPLVRAALHERLRKGKVIQIAGGN